MLSKNILHTLQLPTISLISSFYEIPKNLEELFVAMIALYEENPTPETAKEITDKIQSNENVLTKQEWLSNQTAHISKSKKADIYKKHIENKQPVPVGLPTSGSFLVNMNVVSALDKNTLIEAQAASRILAHTLDVGSKDYFNPSYPSHPYFNGALITTTDKISDAFLDKPFASALQRTEHLVKLVSSYLKADNTTSNEPFLAKAHHTALQTLSLVANTFKETNPKVALQIKKLVHEIQENGPFKAQPETLTTTDYQALSARYKNTPFGEIISHRVNQITKGNNDVIKLVTQAKSTTY